MKEHSNTSLVLHIHHAGKVDQRVIQEGDQFTIGQRPDNDLTLYGQDYPKKHILFIKRDGYYHLNVPKFVDGGEIRAGDSVLNILDLMVHGILSNNNNDSYPIKLSPNKRGFLAIGKTRIDFLFEQRRIVREVVPPFAGFSPLHVTINNLKSDLTFKLIFLVLLLLNLSVLYSFKDYVVKETNGDIEKVEQRFTRFMLKLPQEVESVDDRAFDIAASGETSAESNASKNQTNRSGTRTGTGQRRSGGGNPAARAGLLGLIASIGTGESSTGTSVVDALVNRGLVADLNNIVGGGTNLKVTNGGNNKDALDPLDQLIGTGGSGGIDDFLSAIEDDVPQVELKKQAKVDLVKPSKITGSKAAMGQRTEQSIWSVVSTRQGAIKYLYEKYLKRNPNLRGKVTVEFTIAANGFVTDTRVIESTIDNPEFERELVALVKRLKFDPIPTGNLTTVFPFVFSKID